MVLKIDPTACQCSVDYKLLLEYIKVIFSFPVVILIVAGVVFLKFKGELRGLLGRVRSFEAAGAKAEFEDVRQELVEAAVKTTTDEKAREIELLDDGADKVRKIGELEVERDRLRQKLTSALWDPSLRQAVPSSIESREDPRMTLLARQLHYLRIKYACQDIVLDWIKKYNVRVRRSDNLMVTSGGDGIGGLWTDCMAREPQLVNVYGEVIFKTDIQSLVNELAPDYPPGPLVFKGKLPSVS
jgi:hypothetical protein